MGHVSPQPLPHALHLLSPGLPELLQHGIFPHPQGSILWSSCLGFQVHVPDWAIFNLRGFRSPLQDTSQPFPIPRLATSPTQMTFPQIPNFPTMPLPY